MKRFFVFAGYTYYPAGGWDDFKGDFDTLEEAQSHLQSENVKETDWQQIVDSSTGEVK